MPIKQPPRLHYHRKKPSKSFIKVYWPYLPLAISIGLSLLVGLNWRPLMAGPRTMAYATNVSRAGLLDATNAQRQSFNKSLLVLNDHLNKAAQTKAEDMATRNYWNHQTPDGRAPWDFIEQTGYKFQKAGENLAYGFSTSTTTIVGWMNSESHKNNMLDNAFTDAGFGIANMPNYQNQGPQTIVVAMYARPLSATLPVNTAEPPSTLQNSPSDTVTPQDTSEKSKKVSFIQSITAGKAPWISAIMAALIASLTTLLVVRHAISLRRFIKAGEKFALKHPLLDVTLISYIVLAYLLNHTVGIIR